jgi:hypothetical protein
MARADDLPLLLSEILDRIEEMREELLRIQRSLEKIEPVESAVETARRF